MEIDALKAVIKKQSPQRKWMWMGIGVAVGGGSVWYTASGDAVSKDLDYIAKVEQAIAQKYGDEAIQNPKAEWDENKEKVYLNRCEIFTRNKEKRRSQRQSRTKWHKGIKKTT